MDRHKLAHAITEYDRQQIAKDKRRGFEPNIYALSIMLGALHEAEDKIAKGAPVRATLLEHFNGRLLDRLLKAAGEATSTLEERRGY